METIDLEQLEIALRELLVHLNEAKNLVWNGKFGPGDRKLQGSIKKCDNILSYVREVKELQSNVVAKENTKRDPDTSTK